MAEKVYASLNPENHEPGGGLKDDFYGTIREARFRMFDYQGTVKPEVPTIGLVIDADDGDEVNDNLSLGKPDQWQPSPDGKRLVNISGNEALTLKDNTNGHIFLKSCVESGFPGKEFDKDDISVLDGMNAHFTRIPAPERKGLKGGKDSKFPKLVLTVDEIVTLPGEKKKPAGAPGGKSSGKGKGKAAQKGKGKAKNGEPSESIKDRAKRAVMEILLEKGEVQITKLPALVFSHLKDDPDVTKIAKLVFDNPELYEEGDWEHDEEKGVLRLA